MPHKAVQSGPKRVASATKGTFRLDGIGAEFDLAEVYAGTHLV
jgi:hypothetical protein